MINLGTNTALPSVSIVIVTWNNGLLLEKCLEALRSQTYKDFEVLVIDNGSSDGSLEGIERRRPTFPLRIERLGSNRGFAAANNIGALPICPASSVLLLNMAGFGAAWK